MKCDKTLVFGLAGGRHSVVITTRIYLSTSSCLWPFSSVFFPGCASPVIVAYFHFPAYNPSLKPAVLCSHPPSYLLSTKCSTFSTYSLTVTLLGFQEYLIPPLPFSRIYTSGKSAVVMINAMKRYKEKKITYDRMIRECVMEVALKNGIVI